MTKRDRPIEIDEEVSDVLAYMARNIPTGRLVGVADAIGRLAPLLWGHFPTEEVLAAWLCCPAISDHGPHTPPISTKPLPAGPYADGGSEGGRI